MKPKKKFKAVLFMTVMILIAMPLGMYTSLVRMQNSIIRDYDWDGEGYSISDEIENRVDSAYNILKIAKKYEADYPKLTPDITALQDAVQRVEHSSVKYKGDNQADANLSMDSPMNNLRNIIKDLDIDSSDKNLVEDEAMNMKASRNNIDRSNYNEEANLYNHRLEEYPSKVMLDIGILKPLPNYKSQ